MRIFRGKPVSPGHAQGHAAVLGAPQEALPVTTLQPGRVGSEIERFHGVLDASYRELQRVQASVRSELGAGAADIFAAHLLFLRDPQFIDEVETRIRRYRLTLESAIQATVDELVRLLGEADDAYLRERAADVRDLQRRLMRQITQAEGGPLDVLAPGTILVAGELMPSDLLECDCRKVVGIVSERGGETGHAAILARALGIPAMTGIADAVQLIEPGMPLLINGQTGEVVLRPGARRREASLVEKRRYDETALRIAEAQGLACQTRDGVDIQLFANLGRAGETAQVDAHNLDGVGLFRTEYLFLDQAEAPSVEQQYEIYSDVALRLRGKPLVIRTLDLGGDKWPVFLRPRFEANPNLGVRGLRLSLLASQDLFRAQVRAILRTARDYEVRILLPMVIGRADLREALSIIRALATEEGIRELPPIGALVETPSAVFAIEEILADVAFVSIGTNDLTQFILAVDRNALALIDDYTMLHPSVLRAVHRVIEASDAAGRPVTVCGEAAADPRVACLLVGLGVRALSMSPMSTARVRYALRAACADGLAAVARSALASDSAVVVAGLVGALLDDVLQEPGAGAIPV